MPTVRKFVHDENIRTFKAKLATESNPQEIRRLEAMIQEEEELYEASLRILKDESEPARKRD